MPESQPTLQHFPGIDLKRYGTTAYGDALYRIVWAESRKHIVQGQWPDGSIGGKWRPRYRQILVLAAQLGVPGLWIMERWLPPEQYHKMTREKWDLLYPQLPFMDRGEYEHCFTFEACDPVNANIDKLIKWVEAGRMGSFQDNLDACRSEYDQDTKNRENEIEARVGNVLPAFGAAAMAGYGGGRGTKTAPILKSANELGLPIGGEPGPKSEKVESIHKIFGSKKRGKEFEVPVKVG